jgi:hypothetical protein
MIYLFYVELLPINKKGTAFNMRIVGVNIPSVLDELFKTHDNHYVSLIKYVDPPKPKYEYEVTFTATAESAHDIKEWFGSNTNRTDKVDMTMPTKITLV